MRQPRAINRKAAAATINAPSVDAARQRATYRAIYFAPFLRSGACSPGHGDRQSADAAVPASDMRRDDDDNIAQSAAEERHRKMPMPQAAYRCAAQSDALISRAGRLMPMPPPPRLATAPLAASRHYAIHEPPRSTCCAIEGDKGQLREAVSVRMRRRGSGCAACRMMLRDDGQSCEERGCGAEGMKR